MSSVTTNNVHDEEDLNDNDLTLITREEVSPTPVLTHEQSQLIVVYRNEELMASNNNKERELREFVREHVWPTMKFLKGEGQKTKPTDQPMSKCTKRSPEFGTSHERPDLTIKERCGYSSTIINILGYANSSVVEKGQLWKTNEEEVMREVRQKRNTAMKAVKETIYSSK